MSKIRKPYILTGCLISVLCLAGCDLFPEKADSSQETELWKAQNTGGMSSTSGDGEDYPLIDKSMYLDVGLLKETADRKDQDDTYTVTRGEFVTSYDLVKGKIYLPDVHELRVSYDLGTMIFEKYEVEPMQYIKAGETIAKVHIELDATEKDELEIYLTRYEQRYQEAEEEYQSKKKDLEKQLQEDISASQKMKLKMNYEDLMEHWETEEKNWQQKIMDTKESIRRYEEAARYRSIIAEEDGYLMKMEYLSEGSEIKNGAFLCGLMKDGAVYVTTEDRKQELSYGCPVEVSFGPRKVTYPGKVVSMDQKTASADSFSESACIRVDCEFKDVYEFNNVSISYVAQSMKDVLLVDRNAVTVEEEIPYVTVVKEDGSRCKTGFIAGGWNQDYYWVYSGLSEGMQLVK